MKLTKSHKKIMKFTLGILVLAAIITTVVLIATKEKEKEKEKKKEYPDPASNKEPIVPDRKPCADLEIPQSTIDMWTVFTPKPYCSSGIPDFECFNQNYDPGYTFLANPVSSVHAYKQQQCADACNDINCDAFYSKAVGVGQTFANCHLFKGDRESLIATAIKNGGRTDSAVGVCFRMKKK
jgi:hypothetical protein